MSKTASSKEETERIRVAPEYWITHDEKQYTIEIELPGVSKRDIELDATPVSLCVSGARGNIEYASCWSFAHEIDPKKAESVYKEGVLTIKLPLKTAITTTKIPVK